MLLLTGPEHRDTYDNGLVLLGGRKRVTVHEEGSSEKRQGTAWCVWDGSIVLVRHFEAACAQGIAPCPDRVLELGSGSGLAGLGLAALFENAEVCLTDIPEALESLSRNVELNPPIASRVSVCACDWTCPPPELLQRPFDVVIAADCVWLEELVEPFVHTMSLISQHNPNCVFFLSYQSRTQRVDGLLFDSLKRHRFGVEKVDMARDEPPRPESHSSVPRKTRTYIQELHCLIAVTMVTMKRPEFKKPEFLDKPAKEIFLGDYDYKFLCMPKLNPWSKKNRQPQPKYGKDDFLGLLLALITGLQHFMACVGGIITPPLLIYNTTFAAFGERDNAVATYLVNASLIASGLCTWLQVSCIPLGKRFQLGTGLLSVMGTSFTWLPVSQEALQIQGTEDGRTWNEAYGYVLGTFALFSIIEMGIAFIPHRVMRRAVPPLVSGVAISLIGIGLVGSGIKNWGGGVFCADNYKGILPPKELSDQCYVENATAPDGFSSLGACYAAPIVPKCSPGNGDVVDFFGRGAYFGMGWAVAGFMILIELFGSPFMKNSSVVLGLLFGCFLSAVIKVDGNSYWTTDIMDNAPVITFLWTTTFPLKIYWPLIIPSIIAYVITAVESIGDISATEEASDLFPEGEEHDKRIQGGILGDGISTLFSTLGMSTPNTTFSQNNGVISLTRCASRSAGYACGLFLILSGIFAKVGAFFVSIPNCVLGGMTTFLFANVLVSGIRVISMNFITRRNRFIIAMAMSIGVGVTIVPQWANSANGLWPLDPNMSAGLRGLRSTVIIILSTGYAIGTLIAMFLHLILPVTEEDNASVRAVRLYHADKVDELLSEEDGSHSSVERKLSEEEDMSHAAVKKGDETANV